MKPSERHKIEQTKQEYPPGTRLELKEMDDPYAPVQPGTRGTVVAVDDMGSICIEDSNFTGVDLDSCFKELEQEDAVVQQDGVVTCGSQGNGPEECWDEDHICPSCLSAMSGM